MRRIRLSKVQTGSCVVSLVGGLCAVAGMIFEKMDQSTRDAKMAKDIAREVVKLQKNES